MAEEQYGTVTVDGSRINGTLVGVFPLDDSTVKALPELEEISWLDSREDIGESGWRFALPIKNGSVTVGPATYDVTSDVGLGAASRALRKYVMSLQPGA